MPLPGRYVRDVAGRVGGELLSAPRPPALSLKPRLHGRSTDSMEAGKGKRGGQLSLAWSDRPNQPEQVARILALREVELGEALLNP